VRYVRGKEADFRVGRSQSGCPPWCLPRAFR
jgi:hypothetical protein